MRPAARRATLLCALAGMQLVATRSVAAQRAVPLSRADFEALFARVDNAGRWGADDTLGTLNLVTAQVRRAAAGEVRDGATVSLSRELAAGPVPGAFEPAVIEVLTVSDTALGPSDGTVTWLAERVTLVYHGWAFSHIDALAHLSWNGRGYNGPAATAAAPGRLDGRALAGGLFTRGVLVDMTELRDVRAGPATAGDLEAWERTHGLRIRSGDVVLIHGGHWAAGAPPEAAVGVHPAAAAWLRERGVAAVGVEGSTDGTPSLVPGITSPFHVLALVAMGMPQLENLDLGALAREARARQRWTFLLTVAPLVIRDGTGSPVNPIAVF